MAKPLKFYNVRTKKSETTGNYKVQTKKVRGKTRSFAVATGKGGTAMWRIMAAKKRRMAAKKRR
jgi:hypothetical protein